MTCFTCHGGSAGPRSESGSRAPVRREPVTIRTRASFPPTRASPPSQVFDKYLQALGGAERLAKLTSYRGQGHLLGIRYGVREGSRGDLRQGAEPA